MAGGGEGRHREWGAHDTQGEKIQRSWDAPGWNSWKVRHSREADEASWGAPDRGIQRQPSCGAVHGLKEMKATIAGRSGLRGVASFSPQVGAGGWPLLLTLGGADMEGPAPSHPRQAGGVSVKQRGAPLAVSYARPRGSPPALNARGVLLQKTVVADGPGLMVRASLSNSEDGRTSALR